MTALRAEYKTAVCRLLHRSFCYHRSRLWHWCRLRCCFRLGDRCSSLCHNRLRDRSGCLNSLLSRIAINRISLWLRIRRCNRVIMIALLVLYNRLCAYWNYNDLSRLMINKLSN